MIPITPVIPGSYSPVTVFAKDQAEYLPLPAHLSPDGTVVTRWRIGWRERLRMLITGDIWLTQLTFHTPLQPVRLDTKCPLQKNGAALQEA